MKTDMRSSLGRTAALPSLLCLLVGVQACATVGALSAGEPQTSFDRAADPAPTVQTLHSLSRVMAAQGRQGECRLVLERLIEDHPRFLQAYNELAELHLRADRFEAAMAVLRAGLEVEPRDGVLLNNLGLCHFLRAEFEPALEQFTLAAAAEPGDARNRANMAAALGMQGRLDEALALYYQILPPAEAHHDVAVLCEAIGLEERARAEFSRAERLATRSNLR